jgi:hypothetical protein
LDEVRSAIGKMKNSKVAGSDAVPAELFKGGGEKVAKILMKLFEKIWSEERVPELRSG